MLCLGRRKNQSIIIGDHITITVLGVVGDVVRLGFEAPTSIPIHREEVYQRILAQKSRRIEAFRKRHWIPVSLPPTPKHSH